ncbi:uncharacterized protein LOC143038002 [Oratosquilla oratoria]|uniref:uncharacterized protein LOC143038002 n=1 Tax=Oratosquilla oratoria TaxID=337810 RepID=UPI003F770D53
MAAFQMRELLCLEQFAMSTRVAWPAVISSGCTMSEIGRSSSSPTGGGGEGGSRPPVQARRNLFGPVDHDENLKFIHDELNKISQMDTKRWNFDFKQGRPLEGRYEWTEMEGEKVPEAYHLQRLPFLSQLECSSPSSVMPPPKPTPAIVTSTKLVTPNPVKRKDPQLASTTDASHPIKTTTTTTTTTTDHSTVASPNPLFHTTSTTASSTSKATTKTSDKSEVVARNCGAKDTSKLPGASRITRQSTITGFMKIRKRPASSSSSLKLDNEPPPALVKKAKTSASDSASS